MFSTTTQTTKQIKSPRNLGDTYTRVGDRAFLAPPPLPFQQRHPHAFWTTGNLMGDRQAVRQPALSRFIAGSNPAFPGSCLSSSSLRPLVVGRVTRARIPSGTPHFTERSSALCHHMWRCLLMVRKPGFQPDNASSILVSASNSKMRESVNGKPRSSNLLTLGSNPSSRAMLPSSDSSRCPTVYQAIWVKIPLGAPVPGVEPNGRKPVTNRSLEGTE